MRATSSARGARARGRAPAAVARADVEAAAQRDATARAARRRARACAGRASGRKRRAEDGLERSATRAMSRARRRLVIRPHPVFEPSLPPASAELVEAQERAPGTQRTSAPPTSTRHSSAAASASTSAPSAPPGTSTRRPRVAAAPARCGEPAAAARAAIAQRRVRRAGVAPRRRAPAARGLAEHVAAGRAAAPRARAARRSRRPPRRARSAAHAARSAAYGATSSGAARRGRRRRGSRCVAAGCRRGGPGRALTRCACGAGSTPGGFAHDRAWQRVRPCEVRLALARCSAYRSPRRSGAAATGRLRLW